MSYVTFIPFIPGSSSPVVATVTGKPPSVARTHEIGEG